MVIQIALRNDILTRNCPTIPQIEESAIAKMASQISRAEAIKIAHASIDVLLSSEATSNAFPAEVAEKAKHFFAQVYDARIILFKKIMPRPQTELLVAAVIHAACRQCKGQSRTFNETVRLTGVEKVAVLEKCYLLVDKFLLSVNNSELKEAESKIGKFS